MAEAAWRLNPSDMTSEQSAILALAADPSSAHCCTRFRPTGSSPLAIATSGLG